MISITLTPEEAKLVVASLSVSAVHHRNSASTYEPETRDRILNEAATYHDLCEVISARLKGFESRREKRGKPVDPDDNWPLNDPRKW